MFFDYQLVFDDEAHADSVLNPILLRLRPWQYVKYTIGEPKHYAFDESSPYENPVITVLYEGWHVNLRLRTANEKLDRYVSDVNPPLHQFG